MGDHWRPDEELRMRDSPASDDHDTSWVWNDEDSGMKAKRTSGKKRTRIGWERSTSHGSPSSAYPRYGGRRSVSPDVVKPDVRASIPDAPAQFIALPLGPCELAMSPLHVSLVPRPGNDIGRIAISYQWISDSVTSGRLLPLERYVVRVGEAGEAEAQSTTADVVLECPVENEAVGVSGANAELDSSTQRGGHAPDQSAKVEIPEVKQQESTPGQPNDTSAGIVDEFAAVAVEDKAAMEILVAGLKDWDAASGWQGLLYALGINPEAEERAAQLRYLEYVLATDGAIIQEHVPVVDVGGLIRLWAGNAGV
ncbi:hypothetical protein IAT38_005871 [Cryptococcus sp. DSM 104549]